MRSFHNNFSSVKAVQNLNFSLNLARFANTTTSFCLRSAQWPVRLFSNGPITKEPYFQVSKCLESLRKFSKTMSYSVLARTVSKNTHRFCSNAVVRYSLQRSSKRTLGVDVITKHHRHGVTLPPSTFGRVVWNDSPSRLSSVRFFSSAASGDGDSNDNDGDGGFKKPEPETQSTGEFSHKQKFSRVLK